MPKLKTHHSKTKLMFYRRIYIAYLIETGVNTIPALEEKSGMPYRTVQDSIKAFTDFGISAEHIGDKRTGNFIITSWGPIKRSWVTGNIDNIITTLSSST